jgi:hypothetical protein
MMNVALAHVDLVPANERDVLVDGVFQKKLDGVDVVLVLKRPVVVAAILNP